MFPIKRKGIQSAAYIKRRRQKLAIQSVLYVVCVALLVMGVSFLSKASFLQIATINIVPAGVSVDRSVLASTTAVTSLDAVREIAARNTQGAWWHLFSKNNIFLYPKNAIRDEVVSTFPRIQSVDFAHSFFSNFNTLAISITERAPFALACAPAVPERCFYMDSTGYIYADAPEFSPGVYVHYYTSSSTAPVTIGKYIADWPQLTIAKESTDYISRMGIHISDITIGDADNYIIKIKNTFATSTAGTSTLIYFNMSQPFEKTLTYFWKFWQSRSNRNFNYIDLRYGKDIIFKMN